MKQTQLVRSTAQTVDIQLVTKGGSVLSKYALIFDARGNGEGGVSPTITGDHQNRITDYTAIVLEIHDDNNGNRSLQSVADRRCGDDNY